MDNGPLTVCLCFANAIECVVPLNEIAGGHVFGPQQHLKLYLHGQNKEILNDLVLSTQDSCYHLVDEVYIAHNTLEEFDVAAVFLPQSSPSVRNPLSSDGLPSFKLQESCHLNSNLLPSYILSVSAFLKDKLSDKSKVLLLGPKANVAATLLSRRLQCVGGNQLLAFPTHQNTKAEKNHTGSQYKTAHNLCYIVSKWWAGTEDTSEKLDAGVQFFYNRRSIPIQEKGVFFSVPVNIVGEKMFKIDPVCRIDAVELNKEVQDTENAFCEMKDMVKTEYKNSNVNIFYAQL